MRAEQMRLVAHQLISDGVYSDEIKAIHPYFEKITSILIRYRYIPAWRYLTAEDQLDFAHIALYTLGAPFGFTIQLNEGVRENLLSSDPDTQSKAQKYVCDRVRKVFTGANEADPLYWFVIEYRATKKLQPHIHGGCILRYASKNEILQSSRRLNAKLPASHKNSASQFVDQRNRYLKDHNDNTFRALDWSRYSTKWIELGLAAGPFLSNPLRQEAKMVREKAAQLLQEYQGK